MCQSRSDLARYAEGHADALQDLSVTGVPKTPLALVERGPLYTEGYEDGLVDAIEQAYEDAEAYVAGEAA